MKHAILVRKAPNPFSVVDLGRPRRQGASLARRNTDCISSGTRSRGRPARAAQAEQNSLQEKGARPYGQN